MERDFADRMEEEDFAGAVESINADDIAAELAKEGIDDDIYSSQLETFEKLQEQALSGQDPEKLRLMVCQYMLNMMLAHSSMFDSDNHDAIVDNSTLNSFFGSGMLQRDFAEALLGMTGITLNDKDIMKQCMNDALKANQDCLFY
jgi:hypothetical protein